jgi:hypothetical protein
MEKASERRQNLTRRSESCGLTNPLQVTRPLLRFRENAKGLGWGRAPERETLAVSIIQGSLSKRT